MYKNIHTKVLTLIMAIALLGCESDDKVIDTVFDEVNTETPFLRIVNVEGTSLNAFDTSSEMTIDLEYQLMANDPSLEKLAGVDFFVTFNDNTDDGVDNSAGPGLISSLSPADFDTEGPFGNLQASYSFSVAEALTTLGVSEDDTFPGDGFLVTWELVLEDGTRVGPSDVSGDVAAVGGYYSAQYQLLSFLVCPPPVPSPGTWTIEMYDSYGDGWNGASLDIIIDGVTYNFFVSEAEGSESIETLEVPDGASSISIIYNSGAWDSEVTFEIISSTGATIVDQATPSPPAGLELIDTCDETLDI